MLSKNRNSAFDVQPSFFIKVLILYFVMLAFFYFRLDLDLGSAAREALLLPAAYLLFNVIFRLGDRRRD